MEQNAVITRTARESLRGHWGLAIGTAVVYIIIAGLVSIGLNFIFQGLGSIASAVISGPFTLGLTIFFLAIARKQNTQLEMVFKGFNYFATALGTYILMSVIVFLWTLLLVVPGIIAGLSYSMVFYILADEPTLGASAALAKSKRMMQGHKWQFFCLQLRFFGWSILSILTLFIGFLWVMPYNLTSNAVFYEELKKQQANSSEQSDSVILSKT